MTRELLKQKRKEKKLSQFALAIAAKVSRTTITQFECGYRDMTADEMKRIENVLKKGASHGTANRRG